MKRIDNTMPAVNIKLNPFGLIIVVLLACATIYYVYTTAFRAKPTNFGDQSLLEDRISLKKLLSACIEVTQRGGYKVVEIRKASNLNQESKGKTKEGADELKTNGDIQSHRQMVFGLKRIFPSLRVISEEHDDHNVDLHSVEPPQVALPEVERKILSDDEVALGDVTVWIDPLDATQEYTEDLTEYVTTMACVAVRGVPLIGVIHKPFQKVTAWAWYSRGWSDSLDHMLDDRKHSKNVAKDAEQPQKIIVSRSHAGHVREIVQEAFGNDTEVIPAGGAGYKVLKVVDGGVDAYVHTTAIKKWDICAGDAILRTLRGKMTDLRNEEISYGPDMSTIKNEHGLLATFKVDHEQILKAIGKYTA